MARMMMNRMGNEVRQVVNGIFAIGWLSVDVVDFW